MGINVKKHEINNKNRFSGIITACRNISHTIWMCIGYFALGLFCGTLLISYSYIHYKEKLCNDISKILMAGRILV